MHQQSIEKIKINAEKTITLKQQRTFKNILTGLIIVVVLCIQTKEYKSWFSEGFPEENLPVP